MNSGSAFGQRLRCLWFRASVVWGTLSYRGHYSAVRPHCFLHVPPDVALAVPTLTFCPVGCAPGRISNGVSPLWTP